MEILISKIFGIVMFKIQLIPYSLHSKALSYYNI